MVDIPKPMIGAIVGAAAVAKAVGIGTTTVQNAPVAVANMPQSTTLEVKQVVSETISRIRLENELNKDSTLRFRVPIEYDRQIDEFIDNAPDILFTSEYIVEDKKLGCIVVFNRYKRASHYEIFKRNVFAEEKEFTRILYIDSATLAEETKNYMQYIHEVLGFKGLSENSILVFFDDQIKADRLYEYKIRAGLVPRQANEVEYDAIFRSKNLAQKLELDESDDTVYDLATNLYANEDLAWALCLINQPLQYFGAKAFSQSVAEFLEGKDFYTITDNAYILQAFTESANLFTIKESFIHLCQKLGGFIGVYEAGIRNAINEDNSSFSFDKFRGYALAKNKSFALFLNAAASVTQKELVDRAPVKVPQQVGEISIASLDSLTKILKFVRDTILLTIYAKEQKFINLSIAKNANTSELLAKIASIQGTTRETFSLTSGTGIEQFNLSDTTVGATPNEADIKNQQSASSELAALGLEGQTVQQTAGQEQTQEPFMQQGALIGDSGIVGSPNPESGGGGSGQERQQEESSADTFYASGGQNKEEEIERSGESTGYPSAEELLANYTKEQLSQMYSMEELQQIFMESAESGSSNPESGGGGGGTGYAESQITSPNPESGPSGGGGGNVDANFSGEPMEDVVDPATNIVLEEPVLETLSTSPTVYSVDELFIKYKTMTELSAAYTFDQLSSMYTATELEKIKAYYSGTGSSTGSTNLESGGGSGGGGGMYLSSTTTTTTYDGGGGGGGGGRH